MKTSELTGAALDWAVSKCEGFEPFTDGISWIIDERGSYKQLPKYSTDWSQGGPIIERERIEVFIENECWKAYSSNSLPQNFDGETPLIAAMRCYVASKLGDDVQIPNELI